MASPTVLVLNAGSSSLKFSLFQINSGQEILSGLGERLDPQRNDKALIKWTIDGEKNELAISNANHKLALETLIHQLRQYALIDNLHAIGHRVVHGGEFFYDAVIINDEVMDKIGQCTPLAPLHNPANILGINLMREIFPSMFQVAVFDTAFHQSMPSEAFTYALPYELYKKHGIRRYGFHGTSHKYVGKQAVAHLKLPPNNHSIITAHLGNGCSVTAIQNGLSIDTSMGMTPLEGLVMGTRSGDIDPSLHSFIAKAKNISLEEVTHLLNNQSGLLGVSGLSNDMRTLCKAATEGHKQAQLAINLFCYRLAKSICALAMPLGKIDALVFTGGIGENASQIRALTLQHLSLLHFELDSERNNTHGKNHGGLITTPTSTKALVINTAEEWAIAQDTAKLTCA